MIFFYILTAVVCILFGATIAFTYMKKREIHGIMRVNLDDPTKELYSLELFCDLDRIPEYKTILLTITVDREK